MNGFPLRLTILALFASAALAQQAPESTPAADTGNEPQKTTQKKLAPKKKIYTNADLASPETEPAEEKDSPTTAVSDSAAVKDGDSSTPVAAANSSAEKTKRSEGNTLRSPVLDAPKDLSHDVLVVPAGTRIQVNLLDSKVTVPVRIGWATAIPALTKVTVEISVLYYPVYGSYYPVPGPNYGSPYYVEVAQLTAVMLDGTRYDLQTDQIPAQAGSEVTFTLLADITLKR